MELAQEAQEAIKAEIGEGQQEEGHDDGTDGGDGVDLEKEDPEAEDSDKENSDKEDHDEELDDEPEDDGELGRLFQTSVLLAIAYEQSFLSARKPRGHEESGLDYQALCAPCRPEQ